MARALRREMSRQERALWQALRGNALDGLHFRRQHIVRGYIVDFYCHRARLAIEVDGPIQQRNPEPDEVRDRILSEEGINVLRIAAKAIDLSRDSVLWLIRQHAQKGVRANQPDPFPVPRGSETRKARGPTSRWQRLRPLL
jgi:very-short-patch-repair endonuclease